MSLENRRLYDRTPLDIGVRFITRHALESRGRVVDISAGGLAIMTDCVAEIGDSVIAYPEGLGRLCGIIRRKFEGGFAIEFDITQLQREYLLKRIRSAVTGVPYIRLLENRARKRITLNLPSKGKELKSGQEFDCEIVDISESGSRIRTDLQPEIGGEICVGSLRGLVVRHLADGFAIEFDHSAPCTERNCA